MANFNRFLSKNSLIDINGGRPLLHDIFCLLEGGNMKCKNELTKIIDLLECRKMSLSFSTSFSKQFQETHSDLQVDK